MSPPLGVVVAKNPGRIDVIPDDTEAVDLNVPSSRLALARAHDNFQISCETARSQRVPKATGEVG